MCSKQQLLVSGTLRGAASFWVVITGKCKLTDTHKHLFVRHLFNCVYRRSFIGYTFLRLLTYGWQRNAPRSVDWYFVFLWRLVSRLKTGMQTGLLENVVLRALFVSRRKWRENLENYRKMSFLICTAHQMLLGIENKGLLNVWVCDIFGEGS